jgi:hypothetical protein
LGRAPRRIADARKRALDPTYAWRYGGALFAGLFDIVNLKTGDPP